MKTNSQVRNYLKEAMKIKIEREKCKIFYAFTVSLAGKSTVDTEDLFIVEDTSFLHLQQ